MARYFIMKPIISDNFIRISAPKELQKGCMNSEFQYLDHKPMEIIVSLDYGTDFPDYIIGDGYAPFISDKLRRLFEKEGICNLFYKKTSLIMGDFDIEELYWFALPPRINCLDPEYIDPDMGIATEIHILDENVGNYQIFKLAGVGNHDVIVTSYLKNMIQEEIEARKMKGIRFKPL